MSEPSAWQLHLELPYPPSVNRIWRRVGNLTLKSAEARAYHERCSHIVWLFQQGRPRPPAEPLALTLLVHPPDRRRRDLDNALKAAQDSIARGLGVDDSLISELHVWRCSPSPPDGRLLVTVRAAVEAPL